MDEDAPLAIGEFKRLESLLFNSYKLCISAEEDAGETVLSRLKRQLNKHRSRFENILGKRRVKERPQRLESSARSLVTRLSR